MAESLSDITENLLRLAEISGTLSAPILAPKSVNDWISNLLQSSRTAASSLSSPEPSSPTDCSIPSTFKVEYNVAATRQTKLSVLYTSEDVDFVLEYPETSLEGVGYLIRRDHRKWDNPLAAIAYSNGKPSGQTVKGKEVTCKLLVHPTDPTISIPCIKTHTTCQGAKCCPRIDIDNAREPHSQPTRGLITQRLQADLDELSDTASPSRDIFRKTAAFIAGLRNLGCGSCETETIPILPPSEQEDHTFLREHRQKVQRGYVPQKPTCAGRLYLDFDHQAKAFVRCELYTSRNRFHLCRHIDDSYDLDYLEAYFNEDQEELDRIENAAQTMGYGPLVQCRTVTNFCSQRTYCPHDHREEDGRLIQPLLIPLDCEVKFTTFQPTEEFRRICPYILVISRGVHPHPIPLPQKTPPVIRRTIFDLLKRMNDDLPDLTPRRFIRHPIVKSFLQQKFPKINAPTLIELHTSLANRAHLKSYITQAKADLFPYGTSWKGVQRLKEWQDAHLPPEEHYIRRMAQLSDFPRDEFDDGERPNLDANDPALRYIICMSPSNSRRLRKAQYLQSDIGFKRIQGYMEFEMASKDRNANTSIIFLRIYLNRQTADAHRIILQEIEKIVFQDTGYTLQWRHLHADSPMDAPAEMILHWTADQHGGQAKGIGLHLQQLAQAMPGKYDLHEPHRLLASLGPYDHLRRVYRLCTIHGQRNIRAIAVKEEVRNLMRSLMCMRHPNWDDTILAIQTQGGKVAQDWVQDKIRSKFAFAAWCWERSFIPEDIWRAGDSHSNMVESVHADVNREGLDCTILGGIKKGEAFDKLKMKTLEAFEEFNINPSYKSGHLSENAITSLKRKNQEVHKNLARQDGKVQTYNDKIQTLRNQHVEAYWQQQIHGQAVARWLVGGPDLEVLLARWKKAAEHCERVYKLYLKQLESRSTLEEGSGKIPVLTFEDIYI
ncbi:hypothetical protein C8R43DRAFT_1141295 [Mycena crocata]|nr:hypothetical protein C8R43DRAFT_1141295 [Mycena crocata]